MTNTERAGHGQERSPRCGRGPAPGVDCRRPARATPVPGPPLSILTDAGARPVIGHRGDPAHAPENTLESFARAIAAGADALELDVHLTQDGVPVVHHDARLERTTGARGPLAGHTLAQLAALDAGACFSPDGGRTFPFRSGAVRVPTLDAVLAAAPGVPLIVEIKARAAAAPVRALLERHGAAPRALVASFHARALDPFRDPAFSVGATQREVLALLRTVLAGRRRVARPRYHAITVPPRYRGLRLPLARLARLLHPHGIPVHVWTIDDPAAARALWKSGVNGIVTNDPGAVSGER